MEAQTEWVLLFVYAVDFQESIEACEVKVGTYSQINEYMTIYDNPRSRSLIDIGLKHSDSTFSDFFFSKNTRSFEAKFHMERPWNVGIKKFQCFESHDQDGFQAHIW